MAETLSSAAPVAGEFTPKLITVLREGYGARDFGRDALAGLTVAIVALPLSMAIAIASGVTPDRGLYTAIVGGFFISVFGGSRYQIGGPAGAFIVLVSLAVDRHGYDGLALATMMAGALLMLTALLRLGSYVKFIPHPVIVGFTSGIAVIIFASQIKDLFGLTLAGKEPAALLPKLAALWNALPSLSPITVSVSALSLAIILILRAVRPHWPGLLIAVVVTGGLAAYFALPVETIGSRYGGIPNSLPAPALPPFSLAKMAAVFPDALAFALLGAIESLLSAVVADGMSGRRHRSNCELLAQGIGNIASPLFGGICVTGTIARTATNVRSGARGPVAGILHAVFLLLFMLVAAPLAKYIPLAALGAVLAIVAWNMAERRAFAALLKHDRGEALVLLATFLVTIFDDLAHGIALGMVLSSFVFVRRMAGTSKVSGAEEAETPFDEALVRDARIHVFRLAGPFFFGSASEMASVLERIGEAPKGFVLDMSEVPIIDSTGVHALESFVERAAKRRARVVIAGLSPALQQTVEAQASGAVSFADTVEAGVALLS